MKAKKIIVGIAQGLISIAFLMTGTMKMITPYDQLVTQMAWVEVATPGIVKIIGLLEVLGVVGMNLPFLIKKYYKLVPMAAVGLALTMIGAIITHLTIGDNFAPSLILLIIAGFVAWSRKNLLKQSGSSAVTH